MRTTSTKYRFVVGALSLLMTFALVACDPGDSPTTTVPGGSTTTEPVGS